MKSCVGFVAFLSLSLVWLPDYLALQAFAAPAAGSGAASNSKSGSLSNSKTNSGTSSADSDREASCRKFVQEFYTSYRKGCEGIHKVDPLSVTLKTRKASFSPELLQKLDDDQTFAAKFPGEIVGLDFDPIFNGQDMAETYSVAKVTAAAGKYHADVYGIWDGKKSSKPDVVPELEFKNGHWVFVNFLYPESKEPENRDLISVLNAIKKARPALPSAAKQKTKKK